MWYTTNMTFLNKHHSQEARDKIRAGKISEKNPMWAGDKVGYYALHSWVRRRKEKPSFCDNCKERPALDLANISGEYKRNLDDWEWLCRHCHMNKDGRINNLKRGGGKPTSSRTCIICDRKHEALGYCHRHYMQLRDHGRITSP